MRKSELEQAVNSSSHPEKERVIKEVTGKAKNVNYLKYAPLGILLVGILAYIQQCNYLKQQEDPCIDFVPYTFPDSQSYNVLILDFKEITGCSNTVNCEDYFLSELKQVEQELDSLNKMEIKLEHCISNAIGLSTIEDGKRLLKQTNSDLIIWGETDNRDSLIINIQYVSKTKTFDWFKFPAYSDTTFTIQTLSDKKYRKIVTKEIKDIVYLNLAISQSKKNQPVINTLSLLNRISDSDSPSYRDIYHYKSLIQYYSGYTNDAIESISKAITLDSLNYNLHLDKALYYSMNNDKENAIEESRICHLLILSYKSNIGKLDIDFIDTTLSQQVIFSKLDEVSKDWGGYIELIKMLYKRNFHFPFICEIYQDGIGRGYKEQMDALLSKEIRMTIEHTIYANSLVKDSN